MRAARRTGGLQHFANVKKNGLLPTELARLAANGCVTLPKSKPATPDAKAAHRREQKRRWNERYRKGLPRTRNWQRRPELVGLVGNEYHKMHMRLYRAEQKQKTTT